MTGHRVVLTGRGYTPGQLERLRASGLDPVQLDEAAAAATDLSDVRGYVLGGDERLTASHLASMERLQVISFVGTGIGQFVDCAAARARGITLMTTPGFTADAVAEHSLGLLIGLQRGLFAYNEAAKRGEPTPVATPSLLDSAVGIVGMGPIARELVRQLRQLGAREITYWSKTRKHDVEAQMGVRYVSLDALFEHADSVLVLLASTQETRSIIGSRVLARIRKPVFLVNTAAAELVDPRALREALDDGRIAAAAFDGYWQEPLPHPDQDPFGFLSCPDSKFVVTPHVAAKTSSAWPRMVEAAVDNLLLNLEASHATSD